MPSGLVMLPTDFQAKRESFGVLLFGGVMLLSLLDLLQEKRIRERSSRGMSFMNRSVWSKDRKKLTPRGEFCMAYVGGTIASRYYCFMELE
jgi:hypothetical protein